MSGHEPIVWLVCYDISDPVRLRRVREAVVGYGDRVQFSVYRCVLTPHRYECLRADLLAIIDQHKDSVLLIPLGRASSKRAWKMYALGQPPVPYDGGPKVF